MVITEKTLAVWFLPEADCAVHLFEDAEGKILVEEVIQHNITLLAFKRDKSQALDVTRHRVRKLAHRLDTTAIDEILMADGDMEKFIAQLRTKDYCHPVEMDSIDEAITTFNPYLAPAIENPLAH